MSPNVRLRRLALSLSMGLICSATPLFSAAQPTEPPTLRPFKVSFEVIFKGISAGTSTLELSRPNGGPWRYESRNHARGIFRLAFPDDIRQTSLIEWTNGGPRPLRYRADDGGEATDKDIALDFDWTHGRVRGVAERRRVDLPLPVGTHDAMTVQLALMLALSRGESPSRYTLIDKDELKTYVYRDEGRVRLNTPQGEFEAVVWSSAREGSNRLTRVWYVPAWGFLPAQAERRKGDRLEWSMRLRSLERSPSGG